MDRCPLPHTWGWEGRRECWKTWNVSEASVNENDEGGDVMQDLGTLKEMYQGKTSWENNLLTLKSHDMWNYQPRRSFCKKQNFSMPRGLVKMSAQLNMVSTFLSLMAPYCIWPLKWYYLMERWCVHGPVGDTRSMAMARHATLSPQMVDWRCMVVMVEWLLAKPAVWFGVRNHLVISLSRWWSGINAQVHIERAMYSTLQVLRATSDWSLLTQWMRQPE